MTTIKLKIKNKTIELTIEEARRLFNELNKVFGPQIQIPTPKREPSDDKYYPRRPDIFPWKDVDRRL